MRFCSVVPIAAALSLIVSSPTALQAQVADSASAVTQELRALYEADQADRQFTTTPTLEQLHGMVARDSVRRERALELVLSGALKQAEDYYHAAMVLQHGEGSEDILFAHILSTIAAFKGDERGRWLSAAALDRYLHRTDQPQRLGTQYVRSGSDAPWTQGAYIESLPDAIRAEFGVPPLAAQKKQLAEMNAQREERK